MREVFMERQYNALRPVDAWSEQELNELPPHKRLRVKITQDRSGPHHRLFFKMLAHVADGCGMDREELRATVTVGAGHVLRYRKNGEWHEAPRSIAWDKMDQDAFNPFFQKVLTVIEVELGLKKPALLRELREAFPNLWAEFQAWRTKEAA